ncbi:MAG: HEPN domain-containing protein [Patescibacteria group bacterium]
MLQEELIKFWFTSAQEDWKTAQSLMKSERYMHALFFCHLTLEKILKGFISKLGKENKITHDLLLLAQETEIELSEEQAHFLFEVNEFNIRTRYDDYKLSFYKKATKEYAEDYFKKISQFKLWLEQK